VQSLNQLVAVLSEWSAVYMQNSMRNFILYAKETGLSMSQIGALFRVFHRGNCGVSEIGQDMGITNAAASQMLERLVQQGLILRTEDPVDRRQKQIVLTEKGRQIMQESIQARQGWMEELARELSPAEQTQVTTALNILIKNARELEQHPELRTGS
jgi:DNA-binding MarR family transcriptional regulator